MWYWSWVSTVVASKGTVGRTFVWGVAITASAAIAAYYVWSSHNRFELLAGPSGSSYKLDRATGESWFLRGVTATPHRHPNGDANSRAQAQLLPPSELAKLSGQASLSAIFGTFSGKVHNGGQWIVTRLILSISAKGEDGVVLWNRDHSANVTIEPLETANFSVTVIGEHGVKDTSWAIKEAYGQSPRL